MLKVVPKRAAAVGILFDNAVDVFFLLSKK